MKKIHSLILILFLPICVYSQAVVNFPGGTIAYSSDGNQHDKDDWVATALAQAMLWAAGLEDKVVHCDHSNHLGDNNSSWESQMVESSYNGALKWGIKQNIIFNDQIQLNEAIANFKSKVNNISASEPLWFICAGPMEVAWRCLKAVSDDASINNKLQYIHCISHSTWNENHGDTPQMTHQWSDMKSDFTTVKFHDIVDQNGSNGDNDFNTPFDKWYWLRDSSNPDFKWIYNRNDKNTFDPSDAGMTYWLISGGPNGGNEKGGWPEAKDLLENPRRVKDLVPPSIPGVITINSVGATSANITWGASTDDKGISTYEIFVNDVLFKTSATTTSNLDGIACNATSSVKIRAVDVGNNKSGFNTPVNITTEACPPCLNSPTISGGNGAEAGQTSYLTMTLPTTILAENIDNGANGVAYFDNGYGGTVRTDRPTWSTEHGFRLDSDVEFDIEGTDNKIIGGINSGEWAEYTVNVPAEGGTYKLSSVKYSTNSGVNGKVWFKIGNSISCLIDLPNTNKIMTTIPGNFEFTLPEGEHVFLWVSEAFGFNLDEFVIEKVLPSALQKKSITNRLIIYPNPAKNILQVETLSNKVDIYDISGRIIDINIDKTTNGFKLHVDKLNAGIYFIKDDKTVARFFKE